MVVYWRGHEGITIRAITDIVESFRYLFPSLLTQPSLPSSEKSDVYLNHRALTGKIFIVDLKRIFKHHYMKQISLTFTIKSIHFFMATLFMEISSI